MTGAITTKGIKLTSGTDFGSSLPSSMQSNQLFFQTLGSNYILDNVYPVGSIYMSVNSTNPTNLFGGTWEQIQGKFLFGMNSSYPAGSTGGEITHKLTNAEMPVHNHDGLYYSYIATENSVTLNSGSASYHVPWGSSDYTGDYGAGTGKAELVTGEAGGGAAHRGSGLSGRQSPAAGRVHRPVVGVPSGCSARRSCRDAAQVQAGVLGVRAFHRRLLV